MKFSSISKIFFVLVVAASTISQAQMPDFTAPLEVASGPLSDTGLILNPDIAVDSDGSAYVSYADLKEDKDVWVRKLSGTPLAASGAAVNISNTKGFSIQPEIAAGGGRVCVAWQDGEFGSFEIFVACSDDGGKTFGAGVNVSKSKDVDSGVIILGDGRWDGNHDIALDKNKNIYVVWADDRDLKFSKSADGKTFSDPANLPQGTPDVRYPHIKVGGDNSIYIAYNEPSEQSSDVLLLKSTDGGATFSKDPVFATSNRGFSDAAEIAIDAKGAIYIVNDDTTTNPNNADINFSVSTDGGARFEDKSAIAKDGAFPSIATDGKNLFVGFSNIADPRALPTVGFVYSTDGGKSFTRKDIPNTKDQLEFLDIAEDLDITNGTINVSDTEVAASAAQGDKNGIAYITWVQIVGRDAKLFVTTFTP